jgi:hypothetical protein
MNPLHTDKFCGKVRRIISEDFLQDILDGYPILVPAHSWRVMGRGQGGDAGRAVDGGAGGIAALQAHGRWYCFSRTDHAAIRAMYDL